MKKSNSNFTYITLVILIISTFPLSSAYADVYRCDTTPGVVTLTNVQKGKNCKKMVLPPPEKRLPKSPASPDKSKLSGVDGVSNKPSKYKLGYDNALSERKRIIQEEISLERDRLDAVVAKLSNLDTTKNRSPAQTKELASLEKKQALHQGNLDLLQRELNRQ